MNKTIKIACTSGFSLPLDELTVYSSKLKKHSQLEIERLCDSIVNDGFLFPLAVGKLGDKNYIIDGECSYYALQELAYRGYEIPAVPIFYVKTSEKTIRRNILLATSTNHCVTRYSLEEFCNDKELLKSLAFNEGGLIDFYTGSDIEKFFEKTKGVVKVATAEDYLKGIKGGLL